MPVRVKLKRWGRAFYTYKRAATRPVHANMTGVKLDERPKPYADEWRHDPRQKLSFAQRYLVDFDLLAPSLKDTSFPENTGKVPVLREWQQHLRIFPYGAVLVFGRWAYMKWSGKTVHPAVWYAIVVVHTALFVSGFFRTMNALVRKFGYFDAKVKRDGLPKDSVLRVFGETIRGIFFRPLVLMVLSYDRYETPHLSWWFPVQLCLFTIVADFVYYWAHRLTHECTTAWVLHKRHHTTKHPTITFLAFADEPQEWFDAIGTMTLAYMLYPLNHDTYLMWSLYLIAMEASGHSGLRAYVPGVMASPFLRPFGLEMVLEDHDLHHRHGWRDSFNYGKQTLLWDGLFGTKGERIEGHNGNLDWNTPVRA